MSLPLALKQIDDARDELRCSRQFCQAMIVVVIVGLILFGFFAWKTSNYYLAFGEALAVAFKPLLKHMDKLSGDNVEIMQQSGKMITEVSTNQDGLAEKIRRQQLSESQRRQE